MADTITSWDQIQANYDEFMRTGKLSKSQKQPDISDVTGVPGAGAMLPAEIQRRQKQAGIDPLAQMFGSYGRQSTLDLIRQIPGIGDTIASTLDRRTNTPKTSLSTAASKAAAKAKAAADLPYANEIVRRAYEKLLSGQSVDLRESQALYKYKTGNDIQPVKETVPPLSVDDPEVFRSNYGQIDKQQPGSPPMAISDPLARMLHTSDPFFSMAHTIAAKTIQSKIGGQLPAGRDADQRAINQSIVDRLEEPSLKAPLFWGDLAMGIGLDAATGGATGMTIKTPLKGLAGFAADTALGQTVGHSPATLGFGLSFLDEINKQGFKTALANRAQAYADLNNPFAGENAFDTSMRSILLATSLLGAGGALKTTIEAPPHAAKVKFLDNVQSGLGGYVANDPKITDTLYKSVKAIQAAEGEKGAIATVVDSLKARQGIGGALDTAFKRIGAARDVAAQRAAGVEDAFPKEAMKRALWGSEVNDLDYFKQLRDKSGFEQGMADSIGVNLDRPYTLGGQINLDENGNAKTSIYDGEYDPNTNTARVRQDAKGVHVTHELEHAVENRIGLNESKLREILGDDGFDKLQKATAKVAGYTSEAGKVWPGVPETIERKPGESESDYFARLKEDPNYEPGKPFREFLGRYYADPNEIGRFWLDKVLSNDKATIKAGGDEAQALAQWIKDQGVDRFRHLTIDAEQARGAGLVQDRGFFNDAQRAYLRGNPDSQQIAENRRQAEADKLTPVEYKGKTLYLTDSEKQAWDGADAQYADRLAKDEYGSPYPTAEDARKARLKAGRERDIVRGAISNESAKRESAKWDVFDKDGNPIKGYQRTQKSLTPSDEDPEFKGVRPRDGDGPEGPYWIGEKGEDAADLLRKVGKGEVIGALTLPDSGEPVDLVYGREPGRKATGGRIMGEGVAKIDARHPEMLGQLDQFGKGVEVDRGGRIEVMTPDHTFVVNKARYGRNKLWLQTAFEDTARKEQVGEGGLRRQQALQDAQIGRMLPSPSDRSGSSSESGKPNLPLPGEGTPPKASLLRSVTPNDNESVGSMKGIWRSHLIDRIRTQLKGSQAEVAQVRSIVDAANKDEVEYVGIKPYLDELQAKGEKVDTKQLVDFIRQNSMNLREVKLSGSFNEDRAREIAQERVEDRAYDDMKEAERWLESEGYELNNGRIYKPFDAEEWQSRFDEERDALHRYVETLPDTDVNVDEDGYVIVSDKSGENIRAEGDLGDFDWNAHFDELTNGQYEPIEEAFGKLRELHEEKELSELTEIDPDELGDWGYQYAENHRIYYSGADWNDIESEFEYIRDNASDFGVGDLGDPEAAGRAYYADYMLPGGTNYTELLLKLPDLGYRAPHFEEESKDILVHVLYDHRPVDAHGDSLFIQEIQSDLHQAARKSGYYDADARAHAQTVVQETEAAYKQAIGELAQEAAPTLKPLIDDVVESVKKQGEDSPISYRIKYLSRFDNISEHVRENELANAIADDYDRPGTTDGGMCPVVRAIARVLDIYHEDLLHLMQLDSPLEARFRAAATGVDNLYKSSVQEKRAAWMDAGRDFTRLKHAPPKAPAEKTTAWAGLAFRRALTEAVAENKDSISWTTGDVRADAYNQILATNISKVEVTKAGTDNYQLKAFNPEGVLRVDQTVPYEADPGRRSLEALLGNKVASEAKAHLDSGATEPYTATGEQMKLGGQGMRGFYDDILHKWASNYVKQWGAKVEPATVKLDPEMTSGETSADVWVVDITPEMRDAVATQGQYLHQKSLTPSGSDMAERKTPLWMKLAQKLKVKSPATTTLYRETVKPNLPEGPLSDAPTYAGLNRKEGEWTPTDRQAEQTGVPNQMRQRDYVDPMRAQGVEFKGKTYRSWDEAKAAGDLLNDREDILKRIGERDQGEGISDVEQFAARQKWMDMDATRRQLEAQIEEAESAKDYGQADLLRYRRGALVQEQGELAGKVVDLLSDNGRNLAAAKMFVDIVGGDETRNKKRAEMQLRRKLTKGESKAITEAVNQVKSIANTITQDRAVAADRAANSLKKLQGQTLTLDQLGLKKQRMMTPNGAVVMEMNPLDALTAMAEKFAADGGTDHAEFAKHVFDRTGVTLDPDASKALLKRGGEKFAEGSPMEKRLRKAKMNLAQVHADIQTTSTLQMLRAAYKAGLLSSLRVAQASLIGNAGSSLADDIARMPTAMFDTIMSKRTGERTVTTAGWLTGKQATYSLRTAAEMFDALKSGASERDLAKNDIGNRVNWKALGPVGKAVSWSINKVFDVLTVADTPARRNAFARAAVSEAYLDAVNKGLRGDAIRQHVESVLGPNLDPTFLLKAAIASGDASEGSLADVVRRALKEEDVAVFANQSKAAKAAKVISGTPVIGDILLPFSKIPTNTIARGLEYSPAGAVFGVGKALQALASGDVTAQKAASNALGRSLTGTGLMWLGYNMYRQGFVSTATPMNQADKQTMEAAGIQGASVRIGDRWLSIRDVPQVLPLLIGAQIARLQDEQAAEGKQVSDGRNVAAATVGSTVSTIQDLPTLQGIKTATDTMQELSRDAREDTGSPDPLDNRLIAGLGGSIIPQGLADVMTSGDPYKRQGRSFVDMFRQDIPGERESLPVSRDSLGKPIKRAAGLFGQVRGLSPDLSDKLNDPLAQEMYRLHIPLQKPQRVRNETRFDRDRNEQDYADRVKTAGEILDENLRGLINSETYKKMNDQERRAEILAVKAGARREAAQTIKDSRATRP